MPSDTPTPAAILAAHDYIAGVSSCPCGWRWTETRTYACGEDLRIARAYNDHLIAALSEHYHLLPRIKLSDGTSWPRPSQEHDDYYGVGNRLRYMPMETITRSDLLIAAEIVSAYGHLVSLPQRRRNAVCAEIQRSIQAEEKP